MKRLFIVLVILSWLTIVLHAEQAWFIVSGRVRALATVVPFNDEFFKVGSAIGSVRLDMEKRLDAAIMELRICDPERFEAVFEKYALEFKSDDVVVDEGAALPCREDQQ